MSDKGTTMNIDEAMKELQRAYRCIQWMHNAISTGNKFTDEAYHSPTIAAAKRFVFEGALDGSKYFKGKHVSVLHGALRLGRIASHD